MSEVSQVRWLVVGPMLEPPSGKHWVLESEGVQALLQRERPTLRLPAPAGLAQGAPREIELEVDRLRALTQKALIDSVPELAALAQLAAGLDQGDAALSDALTRLPAGPLRTRMESLLAEEAGAPPKQDASAEGIFNRADLPDAGGASAAVDAFVKAIGTSPRKRTRVTRKVRDAFEQAAYAAASDILGSPGVLRFEGSWRGLAMLAATCGAGSGMTLEVHDVPLEEVPALLARLEAEDPSDEPDAVFVPFALDDVALLQQFAEEADRLLCPVVVDIPPSLFGASAESLPEVLEAQKPQEATNIDWLALRQNEASRWLCGVTHRVVLLSEGAAAAHRHVLGSGVWAVAAMLSQSYRRTGSFAAIGGREGGLASGGVRTLTSGRHEGIATPTESFYSLRAQATLAHHGLLAVGSGRNSDRLMLSTAPMVRAAGDAMPLPAQILTGRIVRFARWMAQQVPAGADSATVADLFEHATQVFLFPGLAQGAKLEASLRSSEQGSPPRVAITAHVHPTLAGLPFDLEFELPVS